ncbi:SNARE Bos1 [Schizosaccharomyces cryophilus OY26]|uniref:Protein transport protein BOS1 n=1 Tax=Schizosaccharomyces cryophilus (strain OY26 / ATCC MYA-4695 / CBS 11777 / NBRC 106824 / NRRL Y48691) TaxID=653667 RepID=S9W4A7_SCHCR|nr:SNARE Bos1 [Schizosaccharomyces cryophilus OY26]EPY52815.1 SNARE Bos1 [Schizosaccharomyces cryophilus OY26]
MSNTLYNHCTKLIQSIQKDLDEFERGVEDESNAISLAGIQGQISASFLSLTRSIEDYNSMVKRELIPAKKNKATVRVQEFRQKHSQLSEHFEQLKVQVREAAHAKNRRDLFGRRGYANAAPDNPYGENAMTDAEVVENGLPNITRQEGLLRENDFLGRAETQIDEYLERGRLLLGDLVEQKTILKSTKKKILDVANTLGITRTTLSAINRRSRQDKVIFYLGAAFVFLCFYLIVRWLR